MPGYGTAFVDAVAATIEWVNTQPDLVGAGSPLQGGAHRWRERSPGQGAYALIVYAGGGRAESEAPIHEARISASIYAGSEPAARVAAVAYANLLDQVEYLTPITLPESGAVLLSVDSITGPLHQPDIGEERYIVDAVLHLTSITN